MTITIRALQPAEWDTLRRFWLDGLASAPAFFGGDADAAHSPPQMWQGTIQGPRHQLFGLFDNKDGDDDTLIGISAAFAQREDESGQTAIFGMSFILPAYRGQGLSRLLYQVRMDWSRTQNFRRVVLSHARTNDASRRAHRRFGFALTHTQPHADGGDVEEHYAVALA